MKLRYAIPAALVLALSGTALAQQPQAGRKLTGFSAWSKLVGNTATGKIDGKEHSEYYLDNGTVKALEDSRLHTGKWVLEGTNVCFTFPGTGKECYTVEVMDDVVTFSSKSHGAYRLNILPGNARKL
jgi:hypothetical protein